MNRSSMALATRIGARRLTASSSQTKPPALLLRLRNVPILDALRVEEALFRTDNRSWLITNEWDHDSDRAINSLTGASIRSEAATSIVLGLSGKTAELVDIEKSRAAGVPLCRRFTGGGTVVVDKSTIFVTFLTAADALPDIAPFPEPVLRWTSDIYADAFERCGVRGFATHANDYCVDDRKFGGNAQSISGKRWLHHTSLLWEYERERMSLLRMPAKRPEYRASRPHEEFIRGLRAAGVPDRAAFVEAVIAATADRLELREVSIEETHAAMAAPHRKTTKPVDIDNIDR